MKSELIPISKIKPNPSNPRLIKDDKFLKLVKSIKDFPQMLEIRPIVVNEDMIILGGNMRLRACQDAGLKEVPVIRASKLTPEQQKEFIIKDNLGFGEWDWAMIANEWDEQQLTDWGLDLPVNYGVEIGSDGFTLPDGDKAPFQQMTFTLADAQAERIKAAIGAVTVLDGTQYGNENGNGNALHQIVLEWGERRKLS